MLLLLIRLYWRHVPENKRKICLFQESCSKYVYRINSEKGLIAGLRALYKRVKSCNNRYEIIKLGNEIVLITSDGQNFDQQKINTKLLASNLE